MSTSELGRVVALGQIRALCGAPRLSGTIGVDAAPAKRDAPSIGVLTIMSGVKTGRIVTIPAGRMLDVGRSPKCWLRIADFAVSLKHAQIMHFGDFKIATPHGHISRFSAACLFTDAGSRNGSFINGARTTTATPLEDGDRLQLGLSFLRFSLVTSDEETALRSIYESGRSDALTGVSNRKHLEERLATDVGSAARTGAALSLIMIDIDFFKRVNDGHGHLGGDAVLKAVSGVLLQVVRADDLLARYGGDEFTIVLRDMDKAAATALAERLHQAVEALSVAFEGGQIKVTLSSGVASLAECEKQDRESLLGLADTRLYRAKQTGRSRVAAA